MGQEANGGYDDRRHSDNGHEERCPLVLMILTDRIHQTPERQMT